MRASRLVSVVLLLQARGRLTAEQLAAELDVSVRTVYRDVESLVAAGVPVYGAPGHDGGYQLVDGYRTRLTGLTSDEAEALFLAGLPGPAADLGLGAVLTTAQLKLLAALPDDLRDRAARLQQRFHLDTSGWYADAEPTPHLATVVDALWRQRRVRVRYRRWAKPQEVTRVLAPYGVVLKAGNWYLVAGADRGIRTYRVTQILRAQVTEEPFDRPAGFDLPQHWADYLAEFDDRRYQGEAIVLLTPAVLAELPELLEPVQVRAARDSAQPTEDGWLRVVLPIESVAHAARVLCRLGADAEVLAPPELRQRMAETVAALAKAYL